MVLCEVAPKEPYWATTRFIIFFTSVTYCGSDKRLELNFQNPRPLLNFVKSISRVIAEWSLQNPAIISVFTINGLKEADTKK